MGRLEFEQPGPLSRGGAYGVQETLLIAFALPIAFFEFVERLLMAMGYPAVRKRVPYWLAYAGAGLVEAFHSVARTGGTSEDGLSRFAVRYLNTHHYFRIDKARRDLHWRPRKALEEGIQQTAAAATR